MAKKNKELLGGQALIEGVLMKSSTALGYAVYMPNGELRTRRVQYVPWKKKYPILGWFLIRGFVNLVEMLCLGVKALDYALSIALPDEHQRQSKYELSFSLLTSLLISFGLFIFLPAFVFTKLQSLSDDTLLLNLLEGMTRILIFIVFLLLAGLAKDMARVFGFHGAEHMVVHAYEAGVPLTVDEVRRYSRLHPRCGTSFLLIVFIVSIVVLALFGQTTLLSRLVIKPLMLPVVAGVSYELVRLMIALPPCLTRLFLGPGLLLQLLTTRRPDDQMLRAAIAALTTAKGVD
ncbi:protein DUF1385 [Candidatus Termititenax persephonae]|uniref:Protein DUF1385 n=1 Tax=Candidatus Termititenax persephonae TaxID=2218525 RepID=A0A388TG02_9BACT|nr:protein DUF1385 [Candidatus Termititenax persephonae]